jgi:hypothetical protein
MQYFLEFQQGAPGSAVLHSSQLRFGVLQGGGEVVFGVGDGVAELMASAERHGRRFFLFMAALSAPSYACIARGITRRNFPPVMSGIRRLCRFDLMLMHNGLAESA